MRKTTPDMRKAKENSTQATALNNIMEPLLICAKPLLICANPRLTSMEKPLLICAKPKGQPKISMEKPLLKDHISISSKVLKRIVIEKLPHIISTLIKRPPVINTSNNCPKLIRNWIMLSSFYKRWMYSIYIIYLHISEGFTKKAPQVIHGKPLLLSRFDLIICGAFLVNSIGKKKHQ